MAADASAVDVPVADPPVVDIPHYMKELFFSAISAGNLATIKSDLQANPKLIDSVNANQTTALAYACFKGELEIVDFFLQRLEFSAVLTPNCSGNLPIHFVARDGHTEIMKRLLAITPPELLMEHVMATNSDRKSPLMLATENNNKDIICLLIQSYPPMLNEAFIEHAMKYCHRGLSTVLLTTAAAKFWPMLVPLIQQYPINFREWIRSGRYELLVRLLAYNPDLATIREQNGTTAMITAVHSDRIGILNLLLDYQPNQVSVADNKGWLPMHYAAHTGSRECAKRLLNLTDLSTVNTFHETPLWLAVNNKQEKIAKLLFFAYPEAIFIPNPKGEYVFQLFGIGKLRIEYVPLIHQLLKWSEEKFGVERLRPMIATYSSIEQSTSIEDIFVRALTVQPTVSGHSFFLRAILSENLDLIQLGLKIDPDALASIGPSGDIALIYAISGANEHLAYLFQYVQEQYGPTWIREQLSQRNRTWFASLLGNVKMNAIQRLSTIELDPEIRRMIRSNLCEHGFEFIQRILPANWSSKSNHFGSIFSSLLRLGGVETTMKLFSHRDQNRYSIMDMTIVKGNLLSIGFMIQLGISYLPTTKMVRWLFEFNVISARIRFLRCIGFIPDLPLEVIRRHNNTTLIQSQLTEMIPEEEKASVRFEIYFQVSLTERLCRWIE